MLPKKSRLTKSDFTAGRGRSVPFKFGTIRLLEGESKAAVVVSKKVFAKAVARNALRRRVYGALAPLFKNMSGRRIFVYPNRNAAKAPFTDLVASLKAALASR